VARRRDRDPNGKKIGGEKGRNAEAAWGKRAGEKKRSKDPDRHGRLLPAKEAGSSVDQVLASGTNSRGIWLTIQELDVWNARRTRARRVQCRRWRPRKPLLDLDEKLGTG